MSAYYTDRIAWTPITNTETGEETGTEIVNIPCRVEDTNAVIAGNNGSSIKANSLIFVSIKLAIKKGDTIRIEKIRKNTFPEATKKYQVLKIMSNQGFSVGEWEVLI